MDYELTNEFVWAGVYTAYCTWSILGILLLVAVVKQNWRLLKRIVKYILNTVVFYIAMAFILELALFVRPPVILTTKAATSIALRSWIKEHQFIDIFFALVAIFILFAINLLFHFKVEHKQYKKDLLILTAFNTLILCAGIWLAGKAAYFGLMQEVNRYFGG